MSYKQNYIKQVESLRLEKLQTKYSLEQFEAQAERQREKNTLNSYKGITHNNQLSKTEMLSQDQFSINKQIKYFLNQRNENLLRQRWKVKCIQSDIRQNIKSSSLQASSKKKRKLTLVSPLKHLMKTQANNPAAIHPIKQLYGQQFNPQHMHLQNPSLQFLPNRAYQKYNAADLRHVTGRSKLLNRKKQGQDLIIYLKTQSIEKPHCLPIKSRNLYLNHLKGYQLANRQKSIKRQNHLFNSKKGQTIENPQKNIKLTNSHQQIRMSKSKERHVAPWVEEVHQRLYENRGKCGNESTMTHRSRLSQKLKREQFENTIRSSRLSSQILSQQEIEDLFQQFKNQPIPFWKSNIVNYYYGKLKRIHQYQRLSNSLQK